MEYIETCARFPGHEFASREGSRVERRARAYILVIETDLDARDSLQAGMDRAQQGGLARIFRHFIPI